MSSIPSSILIVGSGVFGLGTAYALTQKPEFKDTKITLLERLQFPAHDASSVDSSRIIRADYPDAAYSRLAAEALQIWRGDFGADGRYNESGLCIVLGKSDPELGKAYMEGSLKNVQEKLGLKVGRREEGGQLTVLENEAAVKEILGSMGGEVGQSGYVNWTSGWANAEAGLRHMRKLAEATGRIEFRTAEIKRLLFKDGNAVEGVELVDGQMVKADLTILATGAWSPKFIDLRGIASASGQVLSYFKVSKEEQARLGGNPALLDESYGFYIIPPLEGELKIARHGYGYANLQTIPHPERPDSGETIIVSLPRTKEDVHGLGVPPEAEQGCREFVASRIPDLADRPFSKTRICWYTDTPNSDWLIDHHPKYNGLFVATGGSGHAYKFLPVIGERVVDVLLRQDRDELGAELRKKWKWPEKRHASDHIWTDDWRGGRKGMILDEEFAK